MFPQNITQVNTSSILRWLKPQIPTSIFKQIVVLFAPCCIPTISLGTSSCGSTLGVYGILFTGVTISDPAFANQTVQVFLSAPEYNYAGSISTITLNASGYWTGDLQSSFEGAPFGGSYPLTITVTLLPINGSVVHQSAPILITALNCD